MYDYWKAKDDYRDIEFQWRDGVILREGRDPVTYVEVRSIIQTYNSDGMSGAILLE